jgi:His-Xaa-Ser system protein HxsD
MLRLDVRPHPRLQRCRFSRLNRLERLVTKQTPEILSLDKEGGVMTLILKKGLYQLEAIFGAAYVLIDRAYILLDKSEDGSVLVHVRAKKGTDAEQDLEALAGDFANEALSQVLRSRIARQHKDRLEAIVGQAVRGALGVSGAADEDDLGLDDLDDDGFLDFLEDPLGIAVPWEEKFKKSTEDGEASDDKEADKAEPGPGDSGGFQPVKPEGPSS